MEADFRVIHFMVLTEIPYRKLPKCEFEEAVDSR